MTSLTIENIHTKRTDRVPTTQASKCGSCMFFVRFSRGNTTLGECHIAAPIVWNKLDERYGVFPIVNDTNFCGEHSSVEGA